MHYDILIYNGTVITMDHHNRLLPDGYVGILGSDIAAVDGRNGDWPKATKMIDARGGLIMPGLVNAHTHAAMTLFRGLADDLPLMDWLNHYIFPVEQRMDGDFVYTGARLACAEMILSGTTTFCDMYLFEHAVIRAAEAAGMRVLAGEVLFTDFPSPSYGALENGLRHTQELIDAYRDHPLIEIAVEPHSMYTCDPQGLQAANALALENKVPLIMHVAESVSELEQVYARYGKKPFEHLESLGILGPHVIADHCVHLDDTEIERMVAHQVKVVHNPESNMKLASGMAPVSTLLGRGLAVGLGTDGCAANNNLDMFGEMDSAAKLSKLRALDPTALDALRVVKMATCDGAKLLGMGDRIGSLAVGKKADVIVIDTHKPHLTPLYNPWSHLVYAASGHDVTHSMINGRLVMADRQLLTLELPAVLEEANRKAELVRTWVREATPRTS